jgi:hypothetical protein
MKGVCVIGTGKGTGITCSLRRSGFDSLSFFRQRPDGKLLNARTLAMASHHQNRILNDVRRPPVAYDILPDATQMHPAQLTIGV